MIYEDDRSKFRLYDIVESIRRRFLKEKMKQDE